MDQGVRLATLTRIARSAAVGVVNAHATHSLSRDAPRATGATGSKRHPNSSWSDQSSCTCAAQQPQTPVGSCAPSCESNTTKVQQGTGRSTGHVGQVAIGCPSSQTFEERASLESPPEATSSDGEPWSSLPPSKTKSSVLAPHPRKAKPRIRICRITQARAGQGTAGSRTSLSCAKSSHVPSYRRHVTQRIASAAGKPYPYPRADTRRRQVNTRCESADTGCEAATGTHGESTGGRSDGVRSRPRGEHRAIDAPVRPREE